MLFAEFKRIITNRLLIWGSFYMLIINIGSDLNVLLLIQFGLI